VVEPSSSRPAQSLALGALDGLSPDDQLDLALERLRGGGGPLAALPIGDERCPSPDRLDGRVLEAICERALAGARGAVFTPAAEASVLAAFGLAHAAASRDPSIGVGDSVAALLGAAAAPPRLREALDALTVLDFACGGGALLAAAAILAGRAGARPHLLGRDVSPLASRATAARLALLGARADVRVGDALAEDWPDADLILANPPFLRHEALGDADKTRAVAASGLSRQADLSAHLAAMSLRRARVAALVLPRALDTSRSAVPLREDARARGAWALRLRSATAGSFAASVDTMLAVWLAGRCERDRDVESAAPIESLSPGELVALARGVSTPRLLARRRAPAPSRAVRVSDVAEVRFGMKSGANGFFHLDPLGANRYRSALAGEVELAASDVAPLLSSLKEVRAPEWAEPSRVLFRPRDDTPTALAYVARGAALGIGRRPSCASRSPWWRIAPGRGPAPVLYPAKVGARAFAYLNSDGLCEDKKWHALFPRDLEPWLLATVLGATPLRLAIDAAARQLTGAQAIADVDCRVLAAAPFPSRRALVAAEARLASCCSALARAAVTTQLAIELARPAQRELDHVVGALLGMSTSAVERARAEMQRRVDVRLERAAQVREAIRRAG
jgi:SAM-dependent methyltransferase